MLDKFPNIQLEDPVFLGSCVLSIVNHFVWFFYFTENHHRFMEIATFFSLMVWLVPFMYFISLSANENTLPAFDPQSASRKGSKKKQNLVKGIINFVLQKKEEILPMGGGGGGGARKEI
ncbi:erv26 super protein [Chytridiales sp. JEL 0842]|nr:erv26 super protein [Chytridiales sp. JEL 0842]